VQISESFYSDSGGNRSLRSDQFGEYWFTSKISNRVQSQEKSLWSDTLSTSHVLWATDELKLRPTSFVGFVAGGGVVRFPDARTRSLYRTALELYPQRNITLSGGFGRSAFAPTAQAALLDLTGEGWFVRADGAPGNWRFNGGLSRQHYNDGNRSNRQDAEILRWIGSRSFAVAAGYDFAHAHFDQLLNHGYFSPDSYHSNLAVTGIRLRSGKHWRGEYLAKVGAEKIDFGSTNAAFEVSARNSFLFGDWELGADYYYYQIAQSAGPFTAHVPRLILIRRF